jgi:hypothetical protein
MGIKETFHFVKGGNMDMKHTPCTRLKGIENFLYGGLMSGEIDVGTTVGELIALVANIQAEKDSHLNKKMSGLVDDYAYR